MQKFTFNLIYRGINGEFIDDENVWIYAHNKLDAMNKITREYPNATQYIFIKLE